MSDEMISRERASTVRLVCQSAAAVFIAGAVLVAVLGSPFGSPPAVSDVAYEDVAARAQEMREAGGFGSFMQLRLRLRRSGRFWRLLRIRG